MALEPQKPATAFLYEDRPELLETFADTVHSSMFDGQTLRITFAVTRMEPSQTPGQTTGKRVPVCRLVLTAAGAAQLMNQVAQLNAAASERRTAEKKGGERG